LSPASPCSLLPDSTTFSAPLAVLCKNSILITLDIASPRCDNWQEPPPIPRRETLAMTHCTRLLRHLIRGIPLACMWLMLLSAETRTVPRLADLCAQSCQGDRRVRPLRGGHGDLSLPLCVCDHGTRDAQNPAHQCDRSSHGVMDPAQLCDAIPANHPEARSMLEGVAPPGVRGALAAALCSHQGPAERGTYPVVDANPYLRGRKGP